MERLRARLTNYTRSNKELYFRKTSLSLSISELGITRDSFDGASIGDADRDLYRKLNRIRLADRNFQREYGLSGCWLLGPFLCWRSSVNYSADDLLISPLFRLPVNIDLGRSKKWSFSLEDEELWINPSLRLYLRHCWGIDLPERLEEDYVPYFTSLGKHIAQIKSGVLPSIPPRTRAIRDEDGFITGREPVNFREVLPPEELEYYELTTDSCFYVIDTWILSQINASRAALVEDYDRMESCQLVDDLLKGKSKNIFLPELNLDSIPEEENKFIAQIDSTQHLAAACAGSIEGLVIQGPPGTGKSQTITNIISRLVSEGKSVLFVSEKRAALDVVYSRLEKGGVSDLAALLHSSELDKSELYKSFTKNLGAKSDTQNWQKCCKELEEVKAEVRSYHQALNKVHKSGLVNAEILARTAGLPSVSTDYATLELGIEELDRACENLDVAQELVSERYLKSPWLFKASFVTNTAELREKIKSLVEALSRLKSVNDQELIKCSDSVSLLLNNKSNFSVARELLSDWTTLEPRLREFEKEIESQSALVNEISSDASLEDVQAVLEHFSEARGVFSWLSSKHRKMVKLQKKITAGRDIINPLSCYKAYIKAKRAEKQLLELTKGIELGVLEVVVAACQRVSLVDAELEVEALAERLKLLKELKAFFDVLPNSYNDLSDTFDDIELVDRIDALLFDKSVVVEKLAKADGKWSETLKASYFRKWTEQVKEDNECLRVFEEKAFELFLERLAECEKSHRSSAVSAVNDRSNVNLDSKGVDLLKREALKKRRVLTPREIMEQGALEAMLQIKPCWLMSPLSISQMLPLKRGLFDVVVFDEASQVVIENSLPAIYRAKSMVVVGDDKQMPPTNFFSLDIEEDDEELEELPESVLDLARLVYPQVRLQSHYRSKAQELIAFSNSAFYESSLRAVPNPESGSPFEFHQLSDCYFSYREGNEREAEAVLKRLKEVLADNPESSVGILAMGVSQMKVLEDKLEEMCARDEEFARLVEVAENLKDGEANVGLFIKNLENVQGDERDIIIISVGYAPNAPGKPLRQAFGPLSQTGGGRRLNVAVTRAKQQIILFASFSPDEIRNSDNEELNLFASYLKYVRAMSEGKRDVALGLLHISQGKFEHASTSLALEIKSELESRGYEVETNVGSCGYFLDLGVKKDGKYVLGVECDGASRFCADYVRERDLTRAYLLKSRGWKMCRVSPVDWLRSKTAQIDKLLSYLS